MHACMLIHPCMHTFMLTHTQIDRQTHTHTHAYIRRHMPGHVPMHAAIYSSSHIQLSMDTAAAIYSYLWLLLCKTAAEYEEAHARACVHACMNARSHCHAKPHGTMCWFFVLNPHAPMLVT